MPTKPSNKPSVSISIWTCKFSSHCTRSCNTTAWGEVLYPFFWGKWLQSLSHYGSMGLMVYLPIWIPFQSTIHVGKYRYHTWILWELKHTLLKIGLSGPKRNRVQYSNHPFSGAFAVGFREDTCWYTIGWGFCPLPGCQLHIKVYFLGSLSKNTINVCADWHPAGVYPIGNLL